MQKLFLSLAVTTAIALTSCQKEDKPSHGWSMFHEAANEYAHIHLPATGYEIRIAQPLTSPDDYSFNTSGIIEYVLNGDVLATVNYGDGERDTIAHKLMDGTEMEIDLTQAKHDEDGDSGDNGDSDDDGKDWDKDDDDKNFDYDKVVEQPLVTVDGCSYIVAGIIKYYKDGIWVVTFDYGDNTCDEWVTKVTDDGVSNFSLNDYPDWN
jgi:hypothetical protein